jgi:hypothetical protein
MLKIQGVSEDLPRKGMLVTVRSFVFFDNENIKNWKLSVALLHTFVAVGKSMSEAVRSNV